MKLYSCKTNSIDRKVSQPFPTHNILSRMESDDNKALHKRQKRDVSDRTTLRFELSDPDTGLISFNADVFTAAISKAKVIILSDKFRETFTKYLPDTIDEKFDAALREEYLISFRNKRELVTAFAGVFRVKYPNIIFFNPIVIFNMALKQQDLRDQKLELDRVVKLQTIFLAIKIVHEFTHLLDIKVSPTVIKLGRSPSKIIREDVKEGLRDVAYDDMGTLMEKELFGGCVEMKSNDDSGFMELDEIGIYKSTKTMWGNFLDVDASSINETDGTVVISLGAEFKSASKPAFERINLKGGGARASTPATGVLPAEEDDEEDEWDETSDFRA